MGRFLSWAIVLAAAPAVTGFMLSGFNGRPVTERAVRQRCGDVSMRLFDHKRRAEALAEELFGTASEEEPTLTNLRPFPGNYKKSVRTGRGPGSGIGGSSGYGMRGQNSRGGVRPGFEGGQQPQYRRAPKWPGRPMGPGHKKTEYALIKIEDLNEAAERFPNRSIIDPGFLLNNFVLTKQKRQLFKVVGGDVPLNKGFTVLAHAFTSSAADAIQAAGGKCALLSATTNEILEMDGVNPEELGASLEAEDAKTEEEVAAGMYDDLPRPGGRRERIRAELRKQDAEAYSRLASA